MNIRCVFEYDDETKSYATYCPELPGLSSCGDTEDEALGNFKEAISLYFRQDAAIPKNTKVLEVAI